MAMSNMRRESDPQKPNSGVLQADLITECVFKQTHYGFQKDKIGLAFAAVYLLTFISVSRNLPTNK